MIGIHLLLITVDIIADCASQTLWTRLRLHVLCDVLRQADEQVKSHTSHSAVNDKQQHTSDLQDSAAAAAAAEVIHCLCLVTFSYPVAEPGFKDRRGR